MISKEVKVTTEWWLKSLLMSQMFQTTTHLLETVHFTIYHITKENPALILTIHPVIHTLHEPSTEFASYTHSYKMWHRKLHFRDSVKIFLGLTDNGAI